MTHLLLIIIYLAFISLGLPDAILGSAWPSMVTEFEVPLSYAGIISMLISICTVISSLKSDAFSRRFGTGKITAFSVVLTAIGLLGFSLSNQFWMLTIWAIPYGLGAGCVDATLNNYVAIHYKSSHMSWLHCMWGIGASTGPLIMGALLTNHFSWNTGYLAIAILQIALASLLFFTLPLWKTANHREASSKALSLKEILRIKKARNVMLLFFCYCSIEQAAGLWAASYLVLQRGIDVNTAAAFAGLFFIGIAFGRFLSGFIAMKLNDREMIVLGLSILGIGIGLMLVPGPDWLSFLAFILCGLGCAPIYPSMMHSIPSHFGTEHSQSILGAASASANAGILVMPPLFGIIANHLSIALLPVFLLLFLAVMIFMHKQLWTK